MTRLRIFCTTLFTNNNIKAVIQMHAFQFDHPIVYILDSDLVWEFIWRFIKVINSFCGEEIFIFKGLLIEFIIPNLSKLCIYLYQKTLIPPFKPGFCYKINFLNLCELVANFQRLFYSTRLVLNVGIITLVYKKIYVYIFSSNFHQLNHLFPLKSLLQFVSN